MVFYDRDLNKMVYRSPDDAWRSFSAHFELLWTKPNNRVDHWNFSLLTVFYQGLMEEVRMKVITKKEDHGYGYSIPTATNLDTKTKQVSATRELKCMAHAAYTYIKEQ